jgi:predicted TIM-barrel fold metal-dependent hydrolase
MRTVILEEHFSVPAAASRVDKETMAKRGYKPRAPRPDVPNPLALLPDLGEQRLKLMDEAGIDVEVLSNSGPGPDLVPGPDGVAMARQVNDHLAAACAKYPDRFAGFASLPMLSPDDAAKELHRSVKQLGFVGAMVNGTTDGRFLDHPSYDPILAAARLTSQACRKAPAAFWKPRVGAGTLKSRFTCCAWWWPARSTSIASSSSSSATWARCCP